MPDRPRNTLEIIARFGFGARGVVYCLVGGLALLAAIRSGQTGGSRSALQTLVAQPFGKVWLALIALGLFGFCMWRIVEAVTDADRCGSDLKGWTVRGAHLISGAIYAGLAVSALSLVFGWGTDGGGGEDRAAQDWTAWLMAKPFGQWLVGLVGAAVTGAGIAFAWRAWRGDVARRLAVPPDKRHWIISLGRLGFAARGVVFVIIGGILILAAWHSNSAEAVGLGGALGALQQQPYGWVLLGLTAIGLFAFGIFGLVQARYRHIDAPDLDDVKAAAAQAGR